MTRLLQRASLVLVFLFGTAAAFWPQAHAQPEELAYNPDLVMEALFAFPLPSQDIFWQGNFEEEVSDETGVVRQAQILIVGVAPVRWTLDHWARCP